MPGGSRECADEDVSKASAHSAAGTLGKVTWLQRGIIMVAQKVVVTEEFGLHLRPASSICELCLKYHSKIQLKKGTNVANAKSVLSVLATRVGQGDEVEIICDGDDEKEALQALIDVFQNGFRLEENGV